MTMMSGEGIHPVIVVDILGVTGMRMSILQLRSRPSVDLIWLLNFEGFHCRDGDSQLHINIRTDKFMLRPRLRRSGIGDRCPKGNRDTIFLTDSLRR